MVITKDQRVCCLLSICCCIVLIVLIQAITLLYSDQQQGKALQTKNMRILELEKILENESEAIPSENTLEYIQNCGQSLITHIDKTKNIFCELHCSFSELLNFLEKYNARPGKIQSLHITRDNGLQVAITVFSTLEEKP